MLPPVLRPGPAGRAPVGAPAGAGAGWGINVGEESEVLPSQDEVVRHRTLGSTLLDPMALPQPLLCA